MDLDLLLGVVGVLKPCPVVVDVPPDRADGGPPQVLAKRRVCEWRVQVPVDQVLSLEPRDDIAVECPLMHLGHHVVHGFAVAERLVHWRVEAVHEAGA